MDLIDKIQDIQIKNFSSYIGSNEADLHIREDIVDLTTKVAIDFAKWILEKDIIKSVFGGFLYNQEIRYTEEQLFEEFLKDYNYEN